MRNSLSLFTRGSQALQLKEAFIMDESITNEGMEGTEARTYSQEEVDELLQKEGDRRVSEAQKKWSRKTEAKVAEAQKLATMNEEQKYQYELESREKAIAEKEAALALAENKATASTVLADKGISAKLVDLVVAEDADTMMSNITLLEKAFKESVKAEVERRLATSTPKKNLPTDTAITRESFSKMSIAQQTEIYQNNPELWKTLTNH